MARQEKRTTALLLHGNSFSPGRGALQLPFHQGALGGFNEKALGWNYEIAAFFYQSFSDTVGGPAEDFNNPGLAAGIKSGDLFILQSARRYFIEESLCSFHGTDGLCRRAADNKVVSPQRADIRLRSEEHTSELQSRLH